MWQTIAPLTDIPENSGREFVVQGKIVAVYRVGEAVHALDGICAHAGGPMGKGMLRGCIVTCPWHGWQFDVSTGQHCLSPQIRQKQYACRVEAGQVQVEFPET